MMYRLVIRLKGITYYFECDTIQEAYRAAKLVAAILKVRTKKPTRKKWIIWTTLDCFYEYDILYDKDKSFDIYMAIRSKLLSYDYWGKTRSYIEKHA